MEEIIKNFILSQDKFYIVKSELNVQCNIIYKFHFQKEIIGLIKTYKNDFKSEFKTIPSSFFKKVSETLSANALNTLNSVISQEGIENLISYNFLQLVEIEYNEYTGE